MYTAPVALASSAARRCFAGACLVAAAATFWIAWWLMPDSATNDAAHILEIVRIDRRMQTEDIRTLVPLLLAFFAGAGTLAIGLARAGALPRWIPAALGVALAATIAGVRLGAPRQAAVLGLFAAVALFLVAVGVLTLAGRIERPAAP